MRHFLVRKRFLAEEHVGSPDADSHWQEVQSVSLYHSEEGVSIQKIADNAFPPETAAEEQDQWSGIIEYTVVLDNVDDNPLSFLTMASQQVRVWPVWDASFQNFPDEPVAQLPDDLTVQVSDIYPGTQSIAIEYQRKVSDNDSFDNAEAVLIQEENPWTAIVAQDRQYILSELADLQQFGKYRIRVATHYTWGLTEYNYDLLGTADGGNNGDGNNDGGNNDGGNNGGGGGNNGGGNTGLPPGEFTMSPPPALRIRGNINSLVD